MSSSIWNLTHPLRTGHIPLKPGAEMFGTVIRHGRMKKTVTVRNLYSSYFQRDLIIFNIGSCD